MEVTEEYCGILVSGRDPMKSLQVSESHSDGFLRVARVPRNEKMDINLRLHRATTIKLSTMDQKYTDHVINAMGPQTTPRLRKVLGSLIQHIAPTFVSHTKS